MLSNNCYINIKCESKNVQALLDTGAAVSVITEDLINSISNLKNRVVLSSGETLRGVGNNKIVVIGNLDCYIDLLSNIFRGDHKFKVIKGKIDTPLILGRDFINVAGIVIDLANNRIVRNKTSDSCSRDTWHINIEMTENSFPLYLFDNETLKPGERRLVPLMTETNVSDGEGCVVPLPLGIDKHWRLAGSIGRLVGGVLWGELANMSKNTVCVEKYVNIGQWQPCLNVINNINCEPQNFDLIAELKIKDLNLSDVQKDALTGVLLHHQDVFSKNDDDLGYSTTITHTIDVGNNAPVRQRFRRLHPPIKEQVERELMKLKKQGVIEDSISPWCSPLVPVKKKDGRLRICIDYRKLNSITKLNSYPLPNINDGLAQFSGAMYFSTLDLLSGYHQVALEEKSKSVTAFATEGGLYQFRVMPQGACNSPATFQQLMNVVLRGLSSKRALAYLDDVLVVGTDFNEHLENLEEVFKRLRAHGLKLSTRKCDLFKPSVRYLGHTLSSNGIMPANHNIDALKNFPEPKTVRQVKRFNGLCNYYGRFVMDMAQLMRPLYAAATKKKLEWTEACRHAFHKIINILSSYPVLSFPRFGQKDEFIVTTDGSGAGMGAVLSQVQDGEERPLGYASASFNPAQHKYSATEKELAALRFGIKHFKDYLYSRNYVIRTDHQAILYLDQMKGIDSRLMRTYEDLQVGSYRLEYVKGSDNVVADALSRAPLDHGTSYDSDHSETVEVAEPVQVIRGGPNSLFEALSYAITTSDVTAVELRKEVVGHLLSNMIKYGFNNKAVDRKLVQSWKDPSIFANCSLIKPFCDLYACDVDIQYSPGPLVQYKASTKSIVSTEIKLQCLGAIHYNVLCRESQPSTREREQLSNNDTVHYLLTDDDTPDDSFEELITDTALYQSHNNFTDKARTANYQIGKVNENNSNYNPNFNVNIPDTSSCLSLHVPNKDLPRLDRQVAEEEIQKLHTEMNHPGYHQTYKACKANFLCGSLDKIVKEVLGRCDVCQRHKVPVVPRNRLEPQFDISATSPGDVLALDLLSFTGKTKRGNVALLMGIDMRTRYGYAVPMRSKTSSMVAKHLESGILANIVAMPKNILSDNGPEFTGKPFRNLLDSYGIVHKTSIPYRPQSNGMIERFNRTIKDRLATALNGNYNDWDLAIYRVVSQYNRATHREINCTPASYYKSGEGPFVSKTRVFTRRPGNRFTPYKVGDLVLRKIPFFNKESRHKLAPKYDGPYRIIGCISDVSYRIKDLQNNRVTKLVHFSQLRKYFGKWPAPVDLPLHEGAPTRGQRKPTVQVAPGREDEPRSIVPYRKSQDDSSDEEELYWEYYRAHLQRATVRPPEGGHVEEIIPNRDGGARPSVSTPEGIGNIPPLQSSIEEVFTQTRQRYRYASVLSGNVSLDSLIDPSDPSPDGLAAGPSEEISNVTSVLVHTPKHIEQVDEIVKKMKNIHELVGRCLELSASGSSDSFRGFEPPAADRAVDPTHSFTGFSEVLERHKITTERIQLILQQTREKIANLGKTTMGNTSELRHELSHQQQEIVGFITDLEDSCSGEGIVPSLESFDILNSKLRSFCDYLSLTKDTTNIMKMMKGNEVSAEETDWSYSSTVQNWELTNNEESINESTTSDEAPVGMQLFDMEDEEPTGHKLCCRFC